MPAIDTIAAYNATAGQTYGTGTMAAGDSATIRSFPLSASCDVLGAGYDFVTTVLPWRVRSALLHDNVRGLEFKSAATAPSKILPRLIRQQLHTGDVLTFELSTAASTGIALGALSLFYSNLPGVAARLATLPQIMGNVANVKPHMVAVGSGANTANVWYDLAITTTENLLKANTDYAVLGYTFEQACAAVGVKGGDTGNLRICGPGSTDPNVTVDYFANLSSITGLPTIPVINSANVNSTYVSLISSAATAAAGTIVLYLAQLSSPFAG